MMTTEHTPKAPHSTGIFALLCGLLHVKGITAPKISQGTSAGGRALNHRRPLLLVPFILLSFALIAPGVASASFVRKFERQITRAETGHVTEACSEAQVKAGPPCVAVSGGVAVDGAGDLWVGDSNKHGLDEFSPASAVPPNDFLQTLGVAAPLNMAIESATSGNFYVSRASSVEVFSPAGSPVETWSGFAHPRVAVDNSPEGSMKDPSACGTVPYLSLGECFVYVYTLAPFNGLEKFTSKGTPVEFTDATKCKAESCGYIEGSKITAAPPSVCQGQLSEDGEEPVVTVDSEGDIYIALDHCDSVLEYLPSGEFKQAISVQSKEVPQVNQVTFVQGVAFDPASGHLVVSLEGYSPPLGPLGSAGAIDEFEAATGKFVNQITATAEGGSLPGIGEMTVDSNGNLYAAGMDGHGVYVWGPGAYRPTVTLGQVSGRTSTSAVLSGSVNPAQSKNAAKAPLTECYFQYTEEAVYEQALAKNEEGGFPKANLQVKQAPCAPDAAEVQKKSEEAEKAGKPEETFAVQGNIEGLLEAGKTYRYRLIWVWLSSWGRGRVERGVSTRVFGLWFGVRVAAGLRGQSC